MDAGKTLPCFPIFLDENVHAENCSVIVRCFFPTARYVKNTINRPPGRPVYIGGGWYTDENVNIFYGNMQAGKCSVIVFVFSDGGRREPF